MRLLAKGTWLRLALALSVAAPLPGAAARAEDVSSYNAPAPVVQIKLTSGNVFIHAWDRSTVQVSADPSVTVERNKVSFTQAITQVPILQGHTASNIGNIVLQEETFVISALPAGLHDVVTINGRGHVDVTIPQSTLLVVAVVSGKGSVTLRDYRAGTFILRLRSGRVRLNSVGGTGFVQTLRGAIFVADSRFDRIRARNATGNIIFEHCDARQIQVSSVTGSVAYDDGSFRPGLARFESKNGSVAIGVNGAANVSAHTAGGNVLTLFKAGSDAQNHESEGTAIIGGGGPIVNANAGGADVFLYDGALRDHGTLPPDWASVGHLLAPLHHPRPRPTST